MKPTVTVLAVVIALSSGAGAAASTRTDDDKKEIQGTRQVSAQLPGMVPDPSTGTIRVVGEPRAVHRVLDADGKVVRSEQVKVEFGPYGEGERGPNAQQVGNYACVVSNTDNPDLQVYRPMALTSDGTSHFTQFIYHLYGLNAARRVEGELQYQIEMCATGGAHAWNNFHHTFVGATVFDKDAERHLIGTDWGSTVVDGAVSSQLGFQAGSPPISVSGSVNVQDQDVHGGNVGGHERMDLDIDPDWNANRVTGYYIAPENFIWDGTADWQGNTVQGLWEYPMSASSWGVYSGGYGVRYHCSSALPSAECALGY